MYQIICPECSNTNTFDTLEKRPEECSFCFTAFNSETPYQEITDQTKKTITGLKLIYQNTSESIDLKGDINILGREHAGAHLFSNIIVSGKPVISRRHCSISKIDGKFYILDEGSTNGTFYGVNKISCSKLPQEIGNNSLIFIGKEAFLVQFIFEETKAHDTEKIEVKTEEPSKPRKYRCKEGCGYESETYQEICPKCMASNSMVEVTG